MIRWFLGFAAALSLTACTAMPDAPAPRPVTVGILAINDFHGALEPPKQAVLVTGKDGEPVAVPAGGAAWLASAIDSLRAKYGDHHAVVSAGDLISASQISSSIFLDEPTIGVMNRIGLDFNAVGNHEFDRGRQELLRMQKGGCEKFTGREPCQVEEFAGAAFRFLSASTYTEDGSTLFPATGLKQFGTGEAQVRVGFIGLTLKGTPSLVSPGGIAGLTFGDEAEAINAAIPRLREQGADAVVVLIHQGARTSGTPDPNGCNALSGELLPILARLDPGVDVVVSGHTHQPYICDYSALDPSRPFLLTSAGVSGKLVTDITLLIDPAAGRVTAREARNVIVQSQPYGTPGAEVPLSPLHERFEPRADIAAHVQLYGERAAELAQRRVGRIDRAAVKGTGPVGGSAAKLIADAQLAATRAAGAQIAFMNPFGVRTSLEPQADGWLTFAQLYNVQPFENALITQSMTGAQIKALLEQGLDDDGPKQHLTPSAGFIYRYDTRRPAGDRIVGMELEGRPIDPAAEYRVTTNSFLAHGGDGFTVLTAQREAVTGMNDIAALEDWVSGDAVRSVPQEQREIEVER